MNLRKEARGRMCTIRIPGHCNHNPETTVLCHLGGGGMGVKQHDLHAAFGCSDCHDVIDGRQRSRFTRTELKLFHLEGVIRTQQILISEGKL
jgi:hypothetical protein